MQYRFISVCLLVLTSLSLSAQKTLKQEIQSIISGKDAKVGVAVLPDNGEYIFVNDEKSYAMLSTFKFPLAMAVLSQMDKNGIPLDSTLLITPSDLLPNTYSPLRDLHPKGYFRISIQDLLKYCVSQSDNNACDILIRHLGGTEYIQEYLDQLGIQNMTIAVTEEQMHQKREYAYQNKTYPSAAVELLEKFMKKDLFSPVYQKFLEQIMIETTTGPDKLKGQLPDSVTVGHKTGSSDRDKKGLKIADNDMGFVLLPDGRHYSIAVFIMDSKETDQTNAAIIARISKAVYDHYQKQ